MCMKNKTIRLLCAVLALATVGSCAACGRDPGGAGGDGTETEAVTHTITDALTKGVSVNDSMLAMEELPAFPGYTMDQVRTRIDAGERGLRADDPAAAEENLALINRLIAEAPKDAAILFPAGTFYIAPGAMGGFDLFDKENLVLHGEGTRLINTSFVPTVADTSHYTESNFFFTNAAKNICIEGFELDYLCHTAADGVIRKVVNGYTYFTVYDEFITGEKIPLTGGEYAYCVSLFSADGVPGEEAYLDSEEDFRLEKDGDEPGAFRIRGQYGKRGDQISVRLASSNIWAPLVYVSQTENLTVRDVTVRTSPTALVYVPAGSADLWVDHLTVEPAPGSQQLFASNVDGVHIAGLRGRLEMTDCRFVGMGDDALNVHSTLGWVVSADGNRVQVTNNRTHSDLEALFAAAGDTVLFYDAAMRPLGTAAVQSFSGDALVVDALPDGVGEGCTVQNISYAPVTRVLRTLVSRGRARGFLIQTKNALIEECTVENLRLPAIIVSPDFDYWYEAGFADNVLIKNNTFRGVCRISSGQVDGAVLISGCHDRLEFPAKGVYGHKNISIVDNTFENCGANAAYARAAANVVFEGNTVTGCRGDIRVDE